MSVVHDTFRNIFLWGFYFFHEQTPFLFATDVYKLPSLPLWVSPQCSLAGKGGDGRLAYLMTTIGATVDLRHEHTPILFTTEVYNLPSLPLWVSPQCSLAGKGGDGRLAYLLAIVYYSARFLCEFIRVLICST